MTAATKTNATKGNNTTAKTNKISATAITPVATTLRNLN